MIWCPFTEGETEVDCHEINSPSVKELVAIRLREVYTGFDQKEEKKKSCSNKSPWKGHELLTPGPAPIWWPEGHVIGKKP